MKPLVSILIPAYNAEQWIASTIGSALAQTWERKEVIIVDDGSSDGTLAAARRFASGSVRVIAQDNQGASGARNTAFAACQGDYIQWLDADDLLHPEKVAVQMRRVEAGAGTRILQSGSWGHFFYRTSHALFRPSELWCDLPPNEWLFRKMMHNLHMQPDSWLVSRELTVAAGPWDTRLWRDNDGEYFARVVAASDGVQFIAEAKSYYRLAGFRSVSYIGNSNKKLESLFISMQLHIKYLRALEDTERTRLACVNYINTWLHHFYPSRLDLAEELRQTVLQLGGTVKEQRLRPKYDWIRRAFGWRAAKEAQLLLPKFKWALIIAWDRAMSRFETSGRPESLVALGRARRPVERS